MRKVLFIFALILMLFCGTTLASTPYLGVNYSRLDYAADGGGQHFYPSAGIIKFGVEFSKHLAMEGKYGFGISHAKKEYAYLVNDVRENQTITVHLTQLAGLYLRGTLPLNNKLDLFAVAGYTKVKGNFHIKNPRISENISEQGEGASLGGGINYNFHKDFAITLEYISYLDRNTYSLNGIELGYKAKF